MPTKDSYFKYIKDRLSQIEDIAFRKMMGEYLIYYKGKYIAAICDDRLLIKPFDGAENHISKIRYERPYDGAKDMLTVDADCDTEYYRKLFDTAFQKLPAVKTKAGIKGDNINDTGI